MSTTITSAALAILMSLSPVEAPRQALPGWAETVEARRTRYESIAADVGAVVEASCAGKGPSCARWVLPLLLGVAWHESGFAPDVDAGNCYRGPGWEGRCDAGRARSMWQIQVGGEEGELYRTNRRAAAAAALRFATRSWNACRKLEPAERWATYAGGRCDNPTARRVSRSLWAAIQRAARAMPVTDAVDAS